MARRSRAKCGGEFTRNKSSNQEPQAIRAMRMVATQAGNTMIWMMVASLARVISTLPTMSKLLRCQAARASGGAGGDDTAGAGASLTGRRSDEVWRVAMRAVTTAAETERRLVPRAIGPIGGETQSITVVKNLLHSDAHAREQANAYAVVSDGSTELKEERSKGPTSINDVSNPAAGSYADGERNADGGDSRGRCDDVDDGGVAGAGGEVLLWLFIVKLLSGEAARAAMKIR
ncbi:hypothetical protein PC129_g10907 [Phytophthora cactorum]|uniref:Uncharacterized protein n=1 Tax=Phytophthora cactorum TaxID=29920 RepID=A0A8T1I1H8_9STRA|nr:hypothetical protein PC113_g13100 [Phytophthora cactorum]KAG2909150.1 hypothetical protein PC115_g13362 [Phytophthora cactorum]KAG2947229.1 hypothetical protein PC117_g6974 [Phytophthora cactorum]KAG2983920.1 hypothetical protein PC119_g20513 [Phytophthora cactorum]KAG2989542.1 hypothetical protein PC118_g6102 [Phytophthora cactorum]